MWEEINYIETKQGEVRGGHYHRSTTELFFIIDGQIELETSRLLCSERELHIIGRGDIAIIEPMEVHTFRCLSAARWINVLSKRMDSANPDFHRP